MPPLRRPKAQSPIWSHYEMLEVGDDERCKVRCVYYGNVYNYTQKMGTGCLKKHTKRCLERREHRWTRIRIEWLLVLCLEFELSF